MPAALVDLGALEGSSATSATCTVVRSSDGPDVEPANRSAPRGYAARTPREAPADPSTRRTETMTRHRRPDRPRRIVAPQRRRARSRIASNTGWRSVGEAEMTRRSSARRRLALERLGQLAVPRLELLEEPHVLDRDHRLGGEGPEELDLAVREAALRAGHVEGAEGATIPAASGRRPGSGSPRRARDSRSQVGTSGIAQKVREVDHRCVANRAGHADSSSSRRWHGVPLIERSQPRGRQGVMRRQAGSRCRRRGRPPRRGRRRRARRSGRPCRGRAGGPGARRRWRSGSPRWRPAGRGPAGGPAPAPRPRGLARASPARRSRTAPAASASPKARRKTARAPSPAHAALREERQRERPAGEGHARRQARPETGSGESGGRRRAPPRRGRGDAVVARPRSDRPFRRPGPPFGEPGPEVSEGPEDRAIIAPGRRRPRRPEAAPWRQRVAVARHGVRLDTAHVEPTKVLAHDATGRPGSLRAGRQRWWSWRWWRPSAQEGPGPA